MDFNQVKEAFRFLMVDDQEVNLRLLERILSREGYQQLVQTQDSTQVVNLVRTQRPDIILLDLHMPGMDGFQVLQALQEVIPPDDYLPILVLTADITPEAKQRALSEGARDFLSKPFDPIEVLLRIRNLLETRNLHLELRHQNEVLEEKVKERTRELEEAKEEILRLLTRW